MIIISSIVPGWEIRTYKKTTPRVGCLNIHNEATMAPGGKKSTLTTLVNRVARNNAAKRSSPKSTVRTAERKSTTTPARSTVVCSPRHITLDDYLAYLDVFAKRRNVQAPPIDRDDAQRIVLASDAGVCESTRFNERFVNAVHSAFGVSARMRIVSTHRYLRDWGAQTGPYKAWFVALSQEPHLAGLVSPHVIRVTLRRERAQSDPAQQSPFERFCTERSLRPMRYVAEHILLGKVRQSSESSVAARDIQQYGAGSVYYRRLYVFHLVIWMLVGECLTERTDGDVLVVMEPRLKPLMEKILTTPGVLLRTQCRASILYI